MSGSPWRAALGPDRFALLDPLLQRYFDTIPDGFEGHGRGVFEEVGTTRRWMRPLLRILGDDILFPVGERDVPFTVRNIPTARGQEAIRTVHVRAGVHRMRDEVRFVNGALIDGLGVPARLLVVLDASVESGALVVRSRGARIRVGRTWWHVPWAPVMTLRESAGGDGQRIELRLDHPLLGRLYGYRGSFSYAVTPA